MTASRVVQNKAAQQYAAQAVVGGRSLPAVPVLKKKEVDNELPQPEIFASQQSATTGIQDATPAFPVQRKNLPYHNSNGAVSRPYQLKANNTGLPDTLKTGVENLSGFDMSDVSVHYNSPRPAQLQALAFAQGTDIHIAPGQERHLPHEAWHVVQQKQGRVQPTMQMKSGVPVNDDAGLEKEADVMGGKASVGATFLQRKTLPRFSVAKVESVQRKLIVGAIVLEKPEDIKSLDKPDFQKYQSNQVSQVEREQLRSMISDNNVFRYISFDEAIKSIRETPIDDGGSESVPQTPADVAKLLNKGVHIEKKSHEYLLQILKGPFEANWFKLRGCLSMNQWPNMGRISKPDHDSSILLMNAMVLMRDSVWRHFSDQTLRNMKDKVAETAESPKMKKVSSELEIEAANSENKDLAQIFESVGAQAVTSDVDLSTGGSNTEIAVGLINESFRNYFGVPYDPGTVFDINVYAKDWIHGEDKSRESTEGTTRTITPAPEVKGMKDVDMLERDKRMEVWSLVKIRRNLTQVQWLSYRKQVLDPLGQNKPAKKSMLEKLGRAEFEYNRFRDKVQTKAAEISKQFKADEDRLIKIGKESKFDKKFEEEALETRASNAVYEEILLEVKALRLSIAKETDEVKISQLGKDLAYKIAQALTYANEVYATEGAVQHTVLAQGADKKRDKLIKDAKEKLKSDPESQELKQQASLKKVKYNLKSELWLQSVNENVGDALHSLHAYHHLPYYAVYRAGKYLSRLTDATTQLLKEDKLKEVANYRVIKTIGENAMAIKKDKVKIEGQEFEGDPELVKKNENFGKMTHHDIDKLQVQIIAYGASVSSVYNANKGIAPNT